MLCWVYHQLTMFNPRELLNYVHVALGGHHAIYERLTNLRKLFMKCPIIKSKLMETCGRESQVEQPLHWILVY